MRRLYPTMGAMPDGSPYDAIARLYDPWSRSVTDDERRAALRRARELLVPGGRLVFDVFTPGADDIAETNGRWLEREPGIFERADWDTSSRTLTLSVRDDHRASTMVLAWLDPE